MNVIDALVKKAIAVGAIAETDQEIYRYAYSNTLFALLTWGLFLLMGGLLGQFVGGLVFLAFYIPLRQFAGGIHQQSKKRCFASSVLLFVTLYGLTVIPAIQAGVLVGLYVLLLPAALALFVLSPLADANKPLSKNEYSVFRKYTRVILLVELCLHIGMWALGASVNLRYFALMATVLAAAMVMAKEIQNRIDKTIQNRAEP